MRIEISQTDGSLPFIDVLPSFGIGQLEGYNGVGKSLTVSLLEICAGARPRMEIQAWRGLCEGMGRLTVTVTELYDATELQWVLDGEQLWRASADVEPAAGPALEWFVNVLIDGRRPNSLDEIRQLLAVERINGDVGLIEELAGRVDLEVRELEGFRVRLLASGKLEQAEQALGGVRDALDELSIDRIAERAAMAAQRRRERDAAETVFRKAVDHRERLEDAIRLRVRLEEIALRGTELEVQIGDLDNRIAVLSTKRAEVERELEHAEAAAGQSEDVRRELARATRSYKTANTRLRNITRDLAEASQIADVNDDADLEQRRGQLERELDDLRHRRIEVDAGPAVVELIDTLHQPLAQAIASGLPDQPLLSAPARIPSAWTVGEVSDALVRRRDELRELPSPRDAQRIDEQIAALTRQLAVLADIKRLRGERLKATQRQNDAQQRSRGLSEQLDKTTSDHLDELRITRRRLDDELSRLGGERTVLMYRRDALGAPQEREALSGQLARLLDELKLADPDVESAYAAALQAAEQERDAYSQLRERERRAAADHERDMVDLHQAIEELHNEGRFAWMAGGTVPLPVLDQPLDQQLDAFRRLQLAARKADTRLTDFRQLFPGLRASLEAVADELRGRAPKAAVRIAEVRHWLEQDAVGWFADPDFRGALLGADASDVTVDLQTRQVSWRVDDNGRRTKPIEALSSGERAFAFTQARLALLQQRAGTVANRLIALDEFGAFVSSNRIRQLAEYLQRWRRMHERDQILVILPANQDYAALSRASDGEQAERFARMATRLKEREWFVEEFDAP